MKQILAKGFAKKDTKAYRPDKETGKWRGAETQNGNFVTIKPGWTAEFKVNGKKHTLELWAFNNRWGAQSMFYKLKKVKEEDSLEETM
tara:strand:- start:788 stop:1051 length:264 start_codon:yes stop_codon:yes gene_type:complete